MGSKASYGSGARLTGSFYDFSQIIIEAISGDVIFAWLRLFIISSKLVKILPRSNSTYIKDNETSQHIKSDSLALAYISSIDASLPALLRLAQG